MPSYPRAGSALSPRERVVLQGLADGRYYAEIAKETGCGAGTARNHAWHAVTRLEAKSVLHAVAQAMRSGQIA